MPNSHRKSVPFCSGVRRPANEVQGPVRSEEGKAAVCSHRDRGHAGAGAGEHGCSPFVQALGLPRCFGAHTQPSSALLSITLSVKPIPSPPCRVVLPLHTVEIRTLATFAPATTLSSLVVLRKISSHWLDLRCAHRITES